MPGTITRPAGRLRPRNALPGSDADGRIQRLGARALARVQQPVGRGQLRFFMLGGTSATLYECAKND